MPDMRVAVVLRAIPHYRRRFYDLLRERLDARDVELILIYGQVGKAGSPKRDTIDIPWARRIRNRVFTLGGTELYWQPCLKYLDDVDLVIATQEAKLLVNYVLVLQNVLGIRKVALWGHGRSYQSGRANPLGSALKRITSRHVHWWFAYTQGAARAAEMDGFPANRITVVQNAIDTRQLIAAREAVRPDTLQRMRDQLGISSENVGIFVGGMYAEKRLEYLLEACRVIKRHIDDFEMIFIGAGPEEDLVKRAAEGEPWIHRVGPVFDEAKIPYFMISKVLLMPGLVGLVILDSLAMEVPLVTTAVPYHSPEIEYARDGENAVIVRQVESVEAYASSVEHLLKDPDVLESLREGCRRTSGVYTIENMVDRFAEGVLRALADPAAA
jgi:glycosyltransferase involved in cell wall biosynthesis